MFKAKREKVEEIFEEDTANLAKKEKSKQKKWQLNIPRNKKVE